MSERESGEHEGQIVTFYSYKGGTGRTMAVANVAWILAANGKRVLVADWDLESPGLHRFYHPFLPEEEVRDASGVIDLIRTYAQAADRAGSQISPELIEQRARVQPHALQVAWEDFPKGGSLEFLSAGHQNLDYSASLGGLDWDNFYERLDGGRFLDALRADMRRNYDYVLIDSRTGLSDIAGICTVHLPDTLVDCFTLSIQGILGAAEIATQVADREDRNIRILPVPMRVDPAEQEKVESGRTMAIQAFADLPAGMTPAQRREYWTQVEVPYRAFYAYEETLAIFGDPPGALTSLLASFERITAHITGNAINSLPAMEESLRNRTKLLFTRKTTLAADEIAVEFCAQDQVWGDWIVETLRAAGIGTRDRQLNDALKSDLEQGGGRTLAVVSGTYLNKYRGLQKKCAVPDLAVYVTVAQPPLEFRSAPSALVAGVPEVEAIDQLKKLVGPGNWRMAESPGMRRVRYPGVEPKINTAPVPNVRFTGREQDLRRLREMLSECGPTDVQPVVLLGLGGIGKTQLAIEYVHRFKSEYDVICWLDSGQPQFIDTTLAQLGERLRQTLGVSIPANPNSGEVARIVLDLLERGKDVQRWLLIFDNAEYVDATTPFLPVGGGHVLITSRGTDWTDHARQLEVDVFERDDSVAHLRMRVPRLTDTDAGKVADAVGDLPLAVALAGAWLRETGNEVSIYLDALGRRGSGSLRAKLEETWALSLTQLSKRSRAAARLFELCSVMAPNIARELLYSSAMAEALLPLDPQLSDPMVIGTLIHEIDRLALIKIDLSLARIQIHPLVQIVVRDRLTEEGRAEEAERHIHQVLASARPSRGVDDRETWDRYQMIWPHLGYARAETSTDSSVRELLIDRLRYLWLRHDLRQGREQGMAIEGAWRQQLRADGSDADLRRQLLHLRSVQANILRGLALFSEAMAIDESVLAEQQELLGKDNPRTLATAGGLAADLRALGRYRDALNRDQETRAIWQERYGDGSPQTLRATNNLAVSYRLTGDTGAALRLDEETFERTSSIFGLQNRETLISAFNVVRDLIETGQYDEAGTRMEAFLTASAETHGAESVETMNGEVLLAITLRHQGRPQAAQRHFHTALELGRRLGDTSSEALIARLAHAVNLLTLGTTSEAEREIQAVRAVYERRLGPGHPHLLVCLLDLACALRFEAPAAALQMARSVVSGLRNALSGSHPYTLAAMSVTASLLADAGEFAQAEEIESRVVDDTARALGRNHPDALRSSANLYITRLALGDQDAANDLERVTDELAVVLGPDHPQIKELSAGHRWMHTLDQQPF